MLEVRKLRKIFDGRLALDDLSLTVPTGTVYGLIGPNGAGKSTVIRHVTGVLRPDGGEILFDGQPVYENPAVKAQIAYIPDDVFYFPSASLTEMKEFYAKVYPTFSREFYEQLLPCFGLNPNLRLRSFSKGMQKQAAFLLALSCRPPLLVLDEPLDGLDPAARRFVCGVLLQDVAQRGTTVLVSSHNLRELEDVCSHVGILNKGRMLLERACSTLAEDTVKAQLVLPEGAVLPDTLPVLHRSESARMITLILRCSQEEARARLAALEPVYFDLIPLSLEDVFIYELGGGADHALNSILM